MIDLVIERKDGITNICEMKFADSPFHFTGEYENKLINKMDVFREETGTKQALKLVMICSAGISGTAHFKCFPAFLRKDRLVTFSFL